MKGTGFSFLKGEIARMCDALFEMGVPENAIFSSKVVAHELLTNAISYGGGVEKFVFRKEEEGIFISVRAKRAFEPPKTIVCADLYAEHGRGLYLVDALSKSRAYSEEDGVCVLIPLQ